MEYCGKEIREGLKLLHAAVSEGHASLERGHAFAVC
jgi:hypothetical protein